MTTEKRQRRGQMGKAVRDASPTSSLSGASANLEASVSNLKSYSPAAATRESDRTAHEAMLALTEIFSNMPNPKNADRRRYVLELEDGELVFRRDEFDLIFDSILNEIFGPNPNTEGDDIVPQKLSKLFPGRRRSQGV